MSGTVWATEPDAELPIQRGSEGPSATEPETVFEVFQRAVKNHAEKPALKFKDVPEGKSAEDVPWKTLTWAQYYLECLRFGKSLISLGFAPHRCVNIIGFNSTEWFIANMGAIAAGGIASGIYTTNMPDACKYVVNHSKAEVVVVEDQKQLAKFVKVAADLKSVKAIVMYKGEAPEGTDCGFPVYTWGKFMELGRDVPDADIEKRIEDTKPGMVCSLVYTSGTTSDPKAVMISNDNMTWTAQTLCSTYQLDSTETLVSYLPLSHIAAQMLDVHAPMALGGTVYFAQPDALKGSLVKTLRDVRPTFFFGIPRVFEKMSDKMQQVERSSGGAKQAIASWAKARGLSNARMHEYGGGGGSPCGFSIAKALVFSKVRANLGLDRARHCFVASAPIAVEILEYLASMNIFVYEVFGQSECTGPHTFNTPDAWKMGTVGRPMLGTESKVLEETGELCYRGRHIFMGYMHNPESTAETIDEDGWMKSGDIATFDDDEDKRIPSPSGFMSITGRIKELIITAGGENIPPVLIENEFKKEMTCIANCVLIGDKRKYLSILIALKSEVDDGVPTDKLADESLEVCEEIGSSAKTIGEAKEDPKWKEYLDAGMKACNERTTSNAQRVAKWALLPHDFSVDGGELTPSMKIKRGPVADKYSDIIDGLYA